MFRQIQFYCRVFLAFLYGDERLKAVAYYNRGWARYEKGHMARAIRDFTRAIEAKPDFHAAWLARGCAYDEAADVGHAIQDFGKAIELKPDDEAGYGARGSAFCGMGDFDRAVQDFTRVIENKPESTMGFWSRGCAHRARGALDLAVQDFSKAVELKSEYADAYMSRATACFETGDYDRMIQDYGRAVELAPDRPIGSYYHVILFLAKARLGQDGTSALADGLKQMKKEHLLAQVIRMFLGEIKPEDLLAAASDEDRKKDREKKCAAAFYAGEFYLLRGEKDHALELFRQCVATGVTTSDKYISAQAELKRIGG